MDAPLVTLRGGRPPIAFARCDDLFLEPQDQDHAAITGINLRQCPLVSYEDWLDHHLRDFDLLSITPETTLPYASLRATLKRLGRPIPANDAWIAALAMQHGLSILSRDEHFDALPDVRRISW